MVLMLKQSWPSQLLLYMLSLWGGGDFGEESLYPL